MRRAVELLPGGRVLEPVVGAGVDHHVSRPAAAAAISADGAVRQGQEHDVVPGEVLHGGVFEDPVGQAMQMGLQFALVWNRRCCAP